MMVRRLTASLRAAACAPVLALASAGGAALAQTHYGDEGGSHWDELIRGVQDQRGIADRMRVRTQIDTYHRQGRCQDALGMARLTKDTTLVADVERRCALVKPPGPAAPSRR